MIDAAHLSGLAVFAGSVVGAMTSLASAWLTKTQEDRTKQALENKTGRQRLYAQFIQEASKLYVDALVRDQAEPSAMVGMYSLIGQMRMGSKREVVDTAEDVARKILNTYSSPNRSFPELRDSMLNRSLVDPLLAFSEVCRDELQTIGSRQKA